MEMQYNISSWNLESLWQELLLWRVLDKRRSEEINWWTHVQPHFWKALVKAFPMICLINDSSWKWRNKWLISLYFCSKRSWALIFMVWLMFSPIFGKLSWRPSQWYVWSLIYLVEWWNNWLIYLYFCSKRSWALIFMDWLKFSPIFGKLSWRPSQWYVWSLIYLENEGING